MAQNSDSSGPIPGDQPQLFQTDEMVDHFKVVRLLGRGGMGEVYLARDTKLGRKVALKVIHPDSIGSQEAVDRFIFEARATARFNHPHIITIYAAGEHEQTPYVALEYLEGQSLRQRIQGEAPGLKESQRLAWSIAQALEEAHKHRILHRDLKPENIQIPKDGRIRVLDFGLADIVRRKEDGAREEISSEDNLNTTQVLLDQQQRGVRGSPPYMAPEQWLDQDITGKADVWALGVLLCELVVGQRPLEQPALMELAAEVVSAAPLPSVATLPGARDKKLPAEMVSLIDRCLLKDPKQRLSARDVAAALEAMVLQDHHRLSSEEGPFRGLRSFGEQHAHLFFGRDEEILTFLERMREEAVLPVVGPSGSGKSSFVMAGVVPRLREQARWQVIQFRPGSDPFRILAGRLLAGSTNTAATISVHPDFLDGKAIPTRRKRESDEIPDPGNYHKEKVRGLARQLRQHPAQLGLLLHGLATEQQQRVLLFVDQLEELHTMVPDAQTRQRFMEALCTAADDPEDPVRVVFTLREDFLSRLSQGAGVREAMSHVTVIRSPEPEALEQILLRPVEVLGYTYDDLGLCQEMIAAVQGEPACLPLLQFVASQLWEQRDREGKQLLRSVYDSLGGVGGALARHAEGVLEGLSPAEVLQARLLLLRLITAEGTRRVLSPKELLQGLEPEAEGVLGRLTHSRLLAVRRSHGKGGEEVKLELAHESLIHSWQQLRRWIEDSREELVFLQEVTQAAELWQRRGCQEELWQGDALAEARRHLQRCSTPAPELVVRFLEVGALKEQGRRQRRRVLLALALALLAAVSIVFYGQKEQAEAQRREAEKQRERARDRTAEAQCEGARAAFAAGRLLEARAKLRGALEKRDSAAARALWWRVDRNPALWVRDFGATVYDLAFAPDGRTLAAACQDRAIYLLDVQTQAVRVLRGHKEPVFALAFSPDGRTLASGDWGGLIRVWDLRQDTVKVLRGHGGAVRRLSFSPDGKRLASASYDATARLWDLAGRAPARVLQGHADHVMGVAFSPDGRTLATAGHDTSLRLWSAVSGEQLRKWDADKGGLETVRFSPDGKILAAAGTSGRVLLWEAATGQARKILPGHKDGVMDLAFAPDSRTLATVGADRNLRLWDLGSGTQVGKLQGHVHAISAVRFSPDGKSLATSSYDHTVRLWDLVPQQAPPRSPSSHQGPVYGLGFSPDGKTLASGGKDGRARLWQVATGRSSRVLAGHRQRIRSLAFSPDGKILATGGYDRTVRLWRPETGALLKALPGHKGGIDAFSFSPDSKVLASGGMDTYIRLWGRSGGLLRRLVGHTAAVEGLAFSRDGRRLYSASKDKTIRGWDPATGKSMFQLRGHTGAVYGLCLHPDGKRLASGSTDRTVRLWDLRSGRGEVLRRFPGRAYSLAFSPDGTRLGVPLSDGTAHILDLASGSSVVLRGHRDEVNTLRFSPDSRLVATASDDGTVRLWDAITGRPGWRAPLMRSRPPEIFSHRGWERLDGLDPTAQERRWRKAVEDRALKGSISEDGSTLCLHTGQGRLEVWDLPTDRRQAHTEVESLVDLLALTGTCLALAGDQARLYDSTGAFRRVASQVHRLVQGDGDEFFLIAGSQVLIHHITGQRKSTREVGPGVQTLLRLEEHLLLGFSDGNMELLPLAPGPHQASFSFKGVPASPVVRLINGPKGTVIAGYANGLLGIWTLNNGMHLYHGRLHGPVLHLSLQGGKLYAATELGDTLVLDLSIFDLEYCALMKQVWQRAPVVWERGLPLLRRPSASHKCKSLAP